MNSQDPPDQQKRGVRQTIRSGLQRAKDALRPPRPESGHPERLNAPSFGTRLFSISRPTTPSSGHRLAWSRLTSSLRALENSAGLFPPLKSAVGALIECLDIVQAAASNRADYGELASELQSMADMLNQHAGDLHSETSNGSIANIAQCIQRQVADIKERKESGAIGRLLDASQDQEDVIRLYRQVENLFRQLQCDIAMRTRDNVEKQLEASTSLSQLLLQLV
ncbi:hypothetical protein FRC11_012220 [Ceratobasidium sp. 423]|nr:hypothetical protein FRC11_012220 [Ceratobasidium sp. 423]